MPIMGPNGPMDPGAMTAGDMAGMPPMDLLAQQPETWQQCQPTRWAGYDCPSMMGNADATSSNGWYGCSQ